MSEQPETIEWLDGVPICPIDNKPMNELTNQEVGALGPSGMKSWTCLVCGKVISRPDFALYSLKG
jgi:hypothetical protein